MGEVIIDKPDLIEIRHPEVEVQLTGQDGNGFFIVGRVRAALREAGVSNEEIKQYADEAMSSDYDNLLQTTMKWVSIT